MQLPHEQLGSFYLGGVHDINGSTSDTPVLYDSRDLTTHAVCVGMTGSGKTGLCIGLLEEAALDRVPALLVDPKGDITNLLLQFPELLPSDFKPWVNIDDARRKDLSVEEYAANTAALWENGLAQWGMDGARIQRLKDSADFTIFTPGSDAGVGVNIMGSMAAPDVDFDAEAELLRERIAGTVEALLGLVDIKADPVRSREGVLLATIFEHYWRNGEDLDLQKLILAIQNPPIAQLGVFDVDTVYPAKERTKLAMTFNNLIASPAFGEWLQGEPLDVDTLLYLDDGKPRHSVFYLAHLTDKERMFFVTLLLNSVITWMRRQSGTTSLRALLYFDEVFGFFPPTAEPPSKRPLLTIMKQARAYGLGAVLVTQNPVDIDYKGLANAGTWFIGKMQTEQDRARVLGGLEGAIADAGGNPTEIDFDSLISRLDSRVFLMHNVHADAPLIFHTRWVMSYLRGPLTRPQVRVLMEQAGKRNFNVVTADSSAAPADESAVTSVPVTESVADNQQREAPDGYVSSPIGLDPDLPQYYLPLSVGGVEAKRMLEEPLSESIDIITSSVVYMPGVLAKATVHFVDRKRRLETQREFGLWMPLSAGGAGINWENAISVEIRESGLLQEPEQPGNWEGPYFRTVPDDLDSVRELKSMEKSLSDWLYYQIRYPLIIHDELDLYQDPDETKKEFILRVTQAARESRNEEADALEDKYEDKISRIQDRIDAANQRIAGLEADLDSRRQLEFIGLGENALGYFLNRRSSRAFSGIGSRRRLTVKARHTLESAEAKVEGFEADIGELEDDLENGTAEITVKWAAALDRVKTIELKPRRADVDVQLVALGWAPNWLFEYSDDDNVARRELIPAFETSKTADE